jgi:hypothetical protein
MFKKLGILTILIVLMLMASVPAVSARTQRLATGSIWVRQTHSYDPGEDWPEFPPPYEPIEPDGKARHVTFNARATNLQENGAFWDASGHLYWFENGSKYRASVHTMMFSDSAYAWWGSERCVYIAANFAPNPDGLINICFVVCDDGAPGRLGNYVYVAAVNYGVLYKYEVLRGNVVIKD